jgi:mono/diheme cytochrome c family protein
MQPRGWPLVAMLVSSLAACRDAPAPTTDAGASPVATTSASAAPVPAPKSRALRREGSSIARSLRGATLLVADETASRLRRLALPLVDGPGEELALEGPPAQVIALDGLALVTVRTPGLVLIVRDEPGQPLAEVGRVTVPADAWGLALSPDEVTVLVTSAWTQKVSGVDLVAKKVRWTLDVAREPRGVVVRPDGSGAYVSHLTSNTITRIDDLATPHAKPIAVPSSPLRSPGKPLGASLAWSLAMSDDGARLFAPRHALGALGKNAWFGAATVDVVKTSDDSVLAPQRWPGMLKSKSPLAEPLVSGADVDFPGGKLAPFTQPRASVLRHSTSTLLVAGEGDDRVVELDARALDPAFAPVRTYKVGAGYDPALGVASSCAAPAGLALSSDERTLWVHCAATFDVAEIALPAAPEEPPPAGAKDIGAIARFAADPLGPEGSLGRRIFHNATDTLTSGGLACAGCHPEGRDDGYVWHEAKFSTADGENANFVGVAENFPLEAHAKGMPRRTPLLVSHLSAGGPFGWHAQNNDVTARLAEGFGLHRWGGLPKHEPQNVTARALRLVPFLQKGLVPPPPIGRPLTAEEERGKQLFSDKDVQCANCHVVDTGYTNRAPYPMPKVAPPAGYDADPKLDFKTPSLVHLAGRAPYFHDGRAATLEDVIEKNENWMGKTKQLSPADRAALVAFLRTL